MNQKSKQNAFYFYKLRFEKENKGETFNKGIVDIERAALASWKRMTLQQRDPFEDLAKQAKAASAPAKKKATRIDKSVLSTIDSEKRKIVNEIVRQSVRNGTLQTQEYYFIAANIFCKTMSNIYFPAELALLKFTLQNGVKQTFHAYINPENIPLGYRFEALELSETTHQLPMPPNAMGVTDFADIEQEINNFVGNNTLGYKKDFIPLFTLDEDIPMIESIWEDIFATSSSQGAANGRYKILSVNQLLFKLKTGIKCYTAGGGQRVESFSGTPPFQSIDDATTQLNRERYMYLNQIACKFHDEKDCSNYCCLSAVKRWAYVISENVCIDLKISLVCGKHFPIGVEHPIQVLEQDYVHNKSKTTAAPLSGPLRNLDCDQEYNSSENWTSEDVATRLSDNDNYGRYRFGVDEGYSTRRSFGRGRGEENSVRALGSRRGGRRW